MCVCVKYDQLNNSVNYENYVKFYLTIFNFAFVILNSYAYEQYSNATYTLYSLNFCFK